MLSVFTNAPSLHFSARRLAFITVNDLNLLKLRLEAFAELLKILSAKFRLLEPFFLAQAPFF